MIRRLIFVLASVFLLAACAIAETPSPTATPPPKIGSCALGEFSTDEAAITAVLNAEGQLVAEKNINMLMNLWAADAVVSDVMHTPNDPADDDHWRGADAIRQRYVYRVFPGAPSEAHPKTLEIAVSGAEAVVTGTTRIGDEVSPGGDRWQLRRVENCWIILGLEFNRES